MWLIETGIKHVILEIGGIDYRKDYKDSKMEGYYKKATKKQAFLNISLKQYEKSNIFLFLE